jgi:Zn-dependent membrane protease YugP
MNPEARGQPVRTKLRTWLLVAAASVTIFGFFHHVDHVVRGNHSGWPFQEELTPFTFSLLIYALLLPGLYLTRRGRLMAGYWLFTAAVLLALVTSVHFVGKAREAPIRDINAVYDSPAVGFLAVADLTVLIASLVVLAGVAIQALRIKGRG